MKTRTDIQNRETESFGGTPKVTRETRVLPGKGFRKDCILASLPAEQRAKVDKWLFDKGLTYAQVAEACARSLGVKVSRSSVGRYYAGVMKSRVAPEKKVGESVSQRVSELLHGKTWPEVFPKFVEGLMDAAWEAMGRFEFELKHEGYTDLKEARWIVRLMKLIIAARRAEHVRTLALGERAAVRNSLRFKVQSSKLGSRPEIDWYIGIRNSRYHDSHSL